MIELQDSMDIKEARRLAVKRRAPWSFLLLAVSLPTIGLLWYGLAQALLRYRTGLYQPTAFLSGGTRIGNILMYVLPFFPSICLGFMAGDSLISCLPAGMEALHPTGRSNLRSSQITMAKFALVAAAVTLPFAFVGANNFFSLTADTISYRPFFSFKTLHYPWSDVDGIATGCTLGKSIDFNFVATVRGGTRIDFLQETRPTFRAAYPQIEKALRGRVHLFSHDGMTPRCLSATPRTWLPYLMNAPNAAK